MEHPSLEARSTFDKRVKRKQDTISFISTPMEVRNNEKGYKVLSPKAEKCEDENVPFSLLPLSHTHTHMKF